MGQLLIFGIHRAVRVDKIKWVTNTETVSGVSSRFIL